MSDQTVQIATLLGRINSGDEGAYGELIPLLYDAMTALARGQRAQWSGEHTMNTTALVHEVYLRLAGGSQPNWEGRGHFLGAVAKAMRHVLIDQARKRRTEKRGGGVETVSLHEGTEERLSPILLSDEGAERLLALEEALEILASESPREAQVVECRFYGGMSIEETAKALGISTMTVKRDWVMARARLAQIVAA